MSLIVYTRTGAVRIVLDPAADDIQNKAINGVDIVQVNWSSAIPVNFMIGDYTMVYGERYTLNTRPRTSRTFLRDFNYSLPFEGEGYKLGRVQYLFLDQYNRFTKSYFFLNATPIDFIRLMVYNLKREYPNQNWRVGGVIDGPVKNIQFNGVNCLDALNQIASAYETELYIEDYKVSLYIRQSYSGITLSFGNGLSSVVEEPQSVANPVTRLYAYGSSRNLGSNYRLGEERLRLNGPRYRERFTTELQDVFEHTEIFEDVYPHRTGVVTGVTSPFIFSDSSMDFDLNSPDVLMPGVSAKVVFNSGLLSGYTFTLDAYDATTKTFTILHNDDDQTVDVPSSVLTPAVGDQYVIVDIIMPESYIVAAEAELESRAEKWLQDNGSPPLKRTVICDPFWFKKNVSGLKLGETITLDVPEMNINLQIRIITINRNVTKPYIYGIELAEEANTNPLIKLITGT